MGLLSIDGEIRVAIAALHSSDPAVNPFLREFHAALQRKTAVVAEQRCPKINDALAFFDKVAKQGEANCLMVVTHGYDDGRPNYEETKADPRQGDILVENWRFLAMGMRKAAQDKLVILAVCFAGADAITETLMKTAPGAFALAVLAPAPGCKLYVDPGAKAIAMFLDRLAALNLNSYEEEHLRDAETRVGQVYKGTLKLWFFGDVPGEDWLTDTEPDAN